MSIVNEIIKKVEEEVNHLSQAVHRNLEAEKPGHTSDSHKGGTSGTENLTIDTDNLAVPETHTGKLNENTQTGQKTADQDTVAYDMLAVPEIHSIRNRKG